jgi:hypothetical protein
MNSTAKHVVGPALWAVIVAAGFLAVPTAQAAHSCTVNGGYLQLYQPDGQHSVSVQANGSTLGPGAVVSTHGVNPVYGNATGSVSGNVVDFVIDWNDNKGTAIYRGTVGDDGIAHGTATGNVIPINLWNPGAFDSTNTLTCPAATPAAQTATVNKPDDIYDQPDGNGTPYKDANGKNIFKPKGQVQLVAPDNCRNNWCHVVAPEVPGDAWIYAGEGYVTQ